jgi:hypothetical protein
MGGGIFILTQGRGLAADFGCIGNGDVTYPLREKLGIGRAAAGAGGARGAVAKARIAKRLGIEIDSINLLGKMMEDSLRAR